MYMRPIQTLATSTDDIMFSVSASFEVETYRPSRWAVADPFAFTDTAVLAGASRLAFPGTRLLTAGGQDRAHA